MGDGTVVRSIKLIDSSNTSFAAFGVGHHSGVVSRFRSVCVKACDMLFFVR